MGKPISAYYLVECGVEGHWLCGIARPEDGRRKFRGTVGRLRLDCDAGPVTASKADVREAVIVVARAALAKADA